MEEKRKRHHPITRHCMVVHAYYPLMETRVERQALALLDHDIEVDVICLREADEEAFDVVDGVQVHRLPVRRHRGSGIVIQLLEYLSFFILAFFRLSQLHRQRHYDVIQVHNLPDFLVFVALIPKLSGARVILDLHDLMPEFYAERFQRSTDSLPVLFVRWQEKISCRFADHIITVTELWREALIGRGQPPEKVSVVMNVADERIFHRPSRIEPQVGDDACLNMFYHGSLTERYGIDLAIRAVGQLRQQIRLHLTIHGGGEYLEDLMRLADELDLGEHVLFSTGFVPTTELPNLIAKADIGLVPYRRGVFTDGILPTKLMEYVALGMPVIAARTPAIAAYFDETMVQFFTPGDLDDLARCILELYNDRERLARLAEDARIFNQRHNWTKGSLEYVRLADQLRMQAEVQGQGR